MSDDQTAPIEPVAPAPEAPAYAMPLPAGYPAYAVPQRPRFADQVMGMRAVVATALACLIVGGLGGYALGHATGGDENRFGGRGPAFFQQRGRFPNGPGAGQAPNGQPPGTSDGIPQQRFNGQNPNN